jgi:hypothetical protein
MNVSRIGKKYAQRLLVSLAHLSGNDPHVLVDFADLTKTVREARLDMKRTTAAVKWLRQRGWARFEMWTGTGYAQITTAGVAEVERLQLRLWSRVTHDRTLRVALLVSLLSNLFILVIRELLP